MSDIPLHPIEKLKAMRDVDAYVFVIVDGRMTRQHFIKRNGYATVNPPPTDGKCESCHRAQESLPPYPELQIIEIEAMFPFGYPLGVVENSVGQPVLIKQFQESKRDGALVAVWMCSSCARLPPSLRRIEF